MARCFRSLRPMHAPPDLTDLERYEMRDGVPGDFHDVDDLPDLDPDMIHTDESDGACDDVGSPGHIGEGGVTGLREVLDAVASVSRRAVAYVSSDPWAFRGFVVAASILVAGAATVSHLRRSSA